MKIALFSDVHGHLRLLLQCLRCWQIQHETMLDGALIAGDLGCFPDIDQADKATKMWIKRDPEEAGFPTYFVAPKNSVQEMIDERVELGPYSKIRCPVLFVAGNHEDYHYLRSLEHSGAAVGAPENTFPVDCYEKFHAIRDGYVAPLKGSDGKTLRVAGLWGVERQNPALPHAIQAKPANRLAYATQGGFDLLLTHDVAMGALPNRHGSQMIAEVLHGAKPDFQLFGHVHPVEGQHEYFVDGSPTRCWILHDLTFGKKCNGDLQGTMAILNWNGSKGDIELVTDDWLYQMRFKNWRHVLP